MRVIDLLNKIANDEQVPKIILYKGVKYCKNNWNCTYYKFGCEVCDTLNIDTSDLNDEVEIIEEPQEHKIPEKICTNRIINTKDILEFEMIQNKINAEYTYAINEIIDYLEEENGN